MSGVTDLAERENRYERPLAQKLLETYVPLQLKTDPDNAAPEAVVEIYQDYAHVQRGINRVFLRLIAALVGGLAFAAFLGFIAVRGSLGHLRRISGEVEAIQAGGDLSRRVGYESRADEVGRLAQAFDRMLARLSDAFRSQQQFVADASHELRTPITVIKGQLEHVTQELQGSASDLAGPTALALEELERMRLIVEDLLLLARLDEGLPLDSEPVEVELVAREALLRVMLLEGRELHVQVEVSEGLYARSDQERLLQVLTILVANSVQHAGDEAEVTISARRKGDNVLMEVSDTGVGIPGKELPHVFKRLYRGSKARAETRGGAGLGLAIAASLVQAMGGSIDARSTPGEGSTFTVLLPLADTQG